MNCKDCGSEFVWTAGEQEFYQQKGFQYPPARCPKCRETKKQQAQAGYDIVCAQCGKPAKVKFQPKGDRPVYCFDCYKANQAGNQPTAPVKTTPDEAPVTEAPVTEAPVVETPASSETAPVSKPVKKPAEA